MASTADILAKVLNFEDPQFFALDRSVLAAREVALLDTDFTGIAVNAPRTVSLANQASLPLVAAVRSDGQREWSVPLRDNAMLVGVNLDDGTVRIADALVTEKERGSRGGRERQAREQHATLAEESAQILTIDARRQLQIDWSPAAWALSLVYFDWPSNRVTVRLEGEGRPPAPGVRAVSPPPSLACGGGEPVFPCYLPPPGSAFPPQPGAVFHVVHSGGATPRLEVVGTFKLRLRGRHLARPGLVHRFDGGRHEDVAAIVPITLALVRLDGNRPTRFDWAVPVYGPPQQPGAMVTGSFAIDALARTNGARLQPGQYSAYLIMDDTLSGPERLLIARK